MNIFNRRQLHAGLFVRGRCLALFTSHELSQARGNELYFAFRMKTDNSVDWGPRQAYPPQQNQLIDKKQGTAASPYPSVRPNLDLQNI